MKMLVIGDAQRVKKYMPDTSFAKGCTVEIASRGASDDEILRVAADADFIMVDAISPVSAYLIKRMPNLKLIHSEGVAYNAIDLDAARSASVVVCNNAGVNAGAVAEQTVLLMLACLRDIVQGDMAVRAGQQIQTKERLMVEGIRELGDCKIGFIGFGAIAQATAWRLTTWGCEMLYNKRTPLDSAEENRLHVHFAEQDEIARTCDIVSLHVPVTDNTRNLVDAEFLAKMKPTAILINTARGEIVDQNALVNALEKGIIGGAGLDTLTPEPVQLDNPLLNLSESAAKRLVLSPHIGGVTEGMFYRAHRTVWENAERIANGEQPINVVA